MEGAGPRVIGDDSGSFSRDTSTKGDAPKKKEEFARAESKAVHRIRLTVLITLLLSAIAVSLGVFFYLRNEEDKDLRDSFEGEATKVLTSLGKTLDETLGATDAFGVKMITYARNSNSSWPYVEVPNFGLHAMKVLQLSKAFFLYTCVLVDGNERLDWQDYASEHEDWIQDGLDLQEKMDDWNYPIIRDFESPYEVLGLEDPIEEPTGNYKNTHLTTWQAAPVVTGPGNPFPYNRDLWVVDRDVNTYRNAIERKRVTMSEFFWQVIKNPDDPAEVFVNRLAAEWGANFIPPDQAADEPQFVLVYPLLDNVDSVEVDIEDDNISVPAVLAFVYYARDFLRDMLPEDSDGVIAVFENSCGGSFTYRIDGGETFYLGQGDQHDPAYDYLVQSSTIGELLKTADSSLTSGYTGVPFDDEFCPKTLSVYASQEYEDQFHTNQPALFTVVTASIFLFTSLVFILYDIVVARRQRRIMTQAKVSGAIVSSLFPQVVRDKLYAEQRGRKSRIEDMSTALMLPLDDSKEAKKKTRPIADLYHGTTVVFMDLAGFTKWSSMRTPVEVFELLEAVYGAFDRIAKRRKVFKVETIGDCYVAVTGIPNAQPDHAVRMVRFATDCKTIFNQVKHDLKASLGADTAELDIRIGMHSGSTTGGVLRGDKGRFQLFGDTVNTASRMESTGVPGKIQCSQATADELVARDKRDWLRIRQTFVLAKGKGEMLVYFIEQQSLDAPHSTGHGNDNETHDESETEHDYSPSSSNRLDMTGGVTSSTMSDSLKS